MNSSSWIDAINLEWSLVKFKVSQVTISKIKLQLFSLKITFVLANSVDPDEMPHYAAFNLGILCLQLLSQIKYAITERNQLGNIKKKKFKTIQDIVHGQDFVVVFAFLFREVM